MTSQTEYLSSMFSLHQQVAVVTGGTGILGCELCLALAQAGASVAVLGRRGEVAKKVAERLIKETGREDAAIPVVADVLDEASLVRARQTVLDKWGRGIHILVNCAGGNQKGATVMPDQSFFDVDVDAFDKVFA